ncbi:MAG TPA: ribonuclease III [Clostridiales bacterium]|jgi:ribonuclease-3|nr:ribonuclease III [Clostridiales bacterium]
MDIAKIQNLIGYEFNNKELLITAFTHSSYSNENQVQSNEMLEFLGDSVLSLAVSEYLYQNANFNWKEKDLSEKRALIVNKTPLAKALDKTSLIDFLRCGVGETRSNPTKSEATKCDLYEAIVGAIFLDGGMRAAKAFIHKTLGANMAQALKAKTGNYVGLLLEHTLTQKKDIFRYTQTQQDQPMFLVEVVLDQKILSKAQAKSKAQAEKLAAKAACVKLGLI